MSFLKLRGHFIRGAVQLGLLAAFCMCTCSLSYAQSGTASLQGSVVDATGAVIPGAEVTLTNDATHVQRKASTSASGLYNYPNTPVGTYTLNVGMAGFQSYTQTHIVLEVGSSIAANVKMTVGSTDQKVEVRSEGLALQTEDATFKQTIDQQTMTAMPLNGRQMTGLIFLSGGSTPAPGGDFTGSKYSYQTVSVSIAGGMGNTTMWRLDGGDNNDYMANTNLPFPFPDAVGQFSVESTALSAQSGMHSGGMVNVVTRSGTNQFHGSAFEFLRNNYLNATNFFSSTKDTLHQNQYGGTFGGPIIKSKLFAFAGYQRWDAKQSQSSTQVHVPTAANLAGDFSVTNGSNCTKNPTQLYDPLTGAILPGNKYATTPTYNAQALNLLKYLPAAEDECGNASYAIPKIISDNQFVTRVDYTINGKNNLYARYFIDGYQLPAFFSPTNILVTTQSGNLQRVQSFTIGEAFTISPRTVNTFNATVSRRRNNRGYAANAINAATLGVDVNQAVPNGLQLTVTGKFTVGGGGNSVSHFNDNALAVSDDITMLRGKHQLVFGGEWVQNQLNISNAYESNGNFGFDGRYGLNGPSGGSGGGDPNLDFLMGAMSSFEQSKMQQNALRAPIPSLYFQDTYHPTSRLTVVGGIRWAPEFLPVDVFNRGTTFDMDAFLTNKTSSVYPNAPAGTFFYGDSGVSRQFTKNSPWQFSPNVGFSWDPVGDGKTVLRGGASLNYDMVNFFTGQRNQQNPPFASAIRQQQTSSSGPMSFSSPWSTGSITTSPFPQPVIPTPEDAQFFPQSQYIVLPKQFHPSYTEQWTASVQRQFGQGWQLQVQYIGSHTVHAPMGTPLSPAVFIPGVWGAGGAGCDGIVRTGPRAVKPGAAGTPCSTVGNQTSRFALTIANPAQGDYYTGGGGGTVLVNSIGMANYNGLITTVQHRLSSNFSLMANHTWSKCMNVADANGDYAGTNVSNPKNPGFDYGPCGSDYRNVENVVLITKSDFHLNRFASLLVNNWEFAPLLHIISGAPFNVTSGQDSSLTDIGQDRPNRVSGTSAYLHQTIQNKAGAATRGYLNKEAFSLVCPTGATPLTCSSYGNYGNVRRNSFRGMTNYQFDAQISRIFPIHENFAATLRLEAFNVLNHPNFNNPTSSNASISSSTFGQITSAGDARIFQASVKLKF